jgi:hypothetical protein
VAARLRGLEDFQDGIDVGCVFQEKIRGVGGEFVGGVFSGGDGDRFGADRAGTGDVMRGVAEHEDALGRELEAVPFSGAGAGEWAERIAVVMVVGECAEFEIVPDAVMRELEFRAAHEVAGEQGEDDVFALPESVEQG